MLSACAQDCEPLETHDFGDPYAEIDCAWTDPEQGDRVAVWRCFEEHLETDLLSGFIFLELADPTKLYLCGKDLVLNSGVVAYDNLVALVTRDTYDCISLTEDNNLGNSFDWLWDVETNILQFIWRPDDEEHKMLTLIIEDADYDVIMRTTIYFKTLSEEE